ncbi:HlyD family type I secretion periplasmic adaptor subunit [uncultured Sphingomonas sp.]|uniref:HlyD family type I secretion periplasmic adaptor subunit n=1 Tax=uncultured Sphingomonas sp. TaxID=158754 RepID=UPI0025D35B34|nr:HlyD family type I secretion periplasmic adaptor subunit [uncultured Sphingomonas sp.]
MSTDIIAAPEHHIEDMATRIKPRTASNMLLWGIVGFFVIAVLWATLFTVDRTVHAPGRVVPGSRMQVVGNLEGGIVSEILVKTGDMVKKGQPLIRLDRTLLGSQLGAGEAEANALAAKIARLEGQIEGRAPQYPSAAGSPTLARQIEVERALYASSMADLSSASAAANARIMQSQRAVSEAESNLQARRSARDAYQQQLTMIRPLVERGIEPRMTMVQLENNLNVSTAEVATAQAVIARAQAGVAEAQSMLSQIRQDWRTKAATELTTAQSEFAARRTALPGLADRARRTTILAPMNGRINRVAVSTVGGVIAPGAPVVELVPSNDMLVVEAMVNPKDIASIRIGQPARLNISAYESAIYGAMDGSVITISPDATVDERTGESHYNVKVEARAGTLKDKDGRPLPIGPGMTVDVNLLGDKRSIISYLFTPITRLSERALRE